MEITITFGIISITNGAEHYNYFIYGVVDAPYLYMTDQLLQEPIGIPFCLIDEANKKIITGKLGD